MGRILIVDTADGSNTLYSENFNAHYHSLNGALQESRHIFVENGFKYFSKSELRILEVGFGTGLNAALTASIAEDRHIKTSYTGVELYPLTDEVLSKMNYKAILSETEFKLWSSINESQWETENLISKYFSILKAKGDICALPLNNFFDLIYFDAFAPQDQPELWSIKLFQKIYSATNENGILITYCAKGIVKQALREVGYKVERLPGPIGKRHIIRAIKEKKCIQTLNLH